LKTESRTVQKTVQDIVSIICEGWVSDWVCVKTLWIINKIGVIILSLVQAGVMIKVGRLGMNDGAWNTIPGIAPGRGRGKIFRLSLFFLSNCKFERCTDNKVKTKIFSVNKDDALINRVLLNIVYI
jgi:hypothetical protein